MALVVRALMAHAGAGRISFQEDSPTTRAEAVIVMASAMYAPATYAGAGLLSRVVLTSSCPDPKSLVLDAPTNHPRAESRTSALDTPKTHASTVSTVSEARVVDTLTHSLIGTQARVADSQMTHIVLGSQARLADTRITHTSPFPRLGWWILVMRQLFHRLG